MRLQVAFQVKFQLIWVKFTHRDLESKKLKTKGFIILFKENTAYFQQNQWWGRVGIGGGHNLITRMAPL